MIMSYIAWKDRIRYEVWVTDDTIWEHTHIRLHSRRSSRLHRQVSRTQLSKRAYEST